MKKKEWESVNLFQEFCIMMLTLLVALENFKFHFDGNLWVTYKSTHLRGGRNHIHCLCFSFEPVLCLVSYFLH